MQGSGVRVDENYHMKVPVTSYSITLRVEIVNMPGMFGKIAAAIGNAGGDIGKVASKVSEAAYKTGVARKERRKWS